jgi:PEP-CTERM motif
MTRRIVVLPLLLAMAATRADAARLDQSYEPPANPIDNVSVYSDVGDIGNGQKAEEAQTFIAGIAGRITEVDLDLQLSGQGNGLLLEIRKLTAGGLPSESPSDLLGAALVSSGVPTAQSQFVAFQFGGNGPMVAPGESLALVLQAPGSGSYSWIGALGNPYPQGTMATLSPYYNDQWAVPIFPSNSVDLGFRTFVEPVPEPSTFAILLAGGAGLAVLLGRRKSGSGPV